MSRKTQPKRGSCLAHIATNFLRKVYTFALARSDKEILRVVLLTLVIACFFLRSVRLWAASASLTAGPTIALASIMLGFSLALTLSLISAFIVLLYYVYNHPHDGIGHRVGFIGFQGEEMENSIGALKAMAAADAAGVYDSAHFPFVEFDIQETKDGELVLFHDVGLGRAFPKVGPNWKPLCMLREQGVDVTTATVQDLTIEQLKMLHLGGRDGVHVPTFAEFLKACTDCDLRRTLAVEIKVLKTDRARQRLLDLISNYLEVRGTELDGDKIAPKLQYKPLGWAGIIAFPHLFAESFGEFKSPQWRRWALEMQGRGIPARCVHFHSLDFTAGA